MRAVVVDISGRHRAGDGRYHLVCAVVAATLSPFEVEKIEDMRICCETADDVSINTVADLVKKACARSRGVIVAEPGELYNYPEWRAEAILGRKFKYVESVGERKAIEVAHHVSLAVHRMVYGPR
ncbi:MAG TPA: DUF2209 family protein [Methanocella sp.]|nr:DUF2209 family protein [Methanocella sp.]